MKTKLLLTALASLLLVGCAHIRPQDYRQMPSKKDPAAYKAAQDEMDGKRHGIWVSPSTNLTIQPWRKFDPVWEIAGNADDPEPPAWYRPNECAFMRKIMWGFRNPLHNLDFYGLGLADKNIVLIGKYPELIGKPGGGWNFTVVAYKRLRLPFISYTHGGFNFYFGWRNHGNFGIKLNYSKKKQKKERSAPVYAPYSPSSS